MQSNYLFMDIQIIIYIPQAQIICSVFDISVVSSTINVNHFPDISLANLPQYHQCHNTKHLILYIWAWLVIALSSQKDQEYHQHTASKVVESWSHTHLLCLSSFVSPTQRKALST